MAQIIYSGRALDDLQRLFQFLAEHDPHIAGDAATAIRSAVVMLASHPLAGRRVEGELRELVISYGKTGYVALYRFLPVTEQIRILSLRHQRELDFPG
ncbi:MAG: type II toxin-antitoxin system RelE/ParE family toxin [Burkholderiales bacterium]|nr:type II toxin-antitoxin system RelE/ParE family toxin [Burkholderiales bacterium]